MRIFVYAKMCLIYAFLIRKYSAAKTKSQNRKAGAFCVGLPAFGVIYHGSLSAVCLLKCRNASVTV